MTAPVQVGTVSALRRYPVKSMLGEPQSTARLTTRGVAGDRDWALIDDETGKVISGKRPKRWLPLMSMTATNAGDDVVIAFPDGRTVAVSDPGANATLSDYLGRPVSLASSPPDNATYDEEWVPELKDGAAPYFDLPTRLEDGGVVMVDGGQFMNDQQSFFDFGRIHLVTTSTTRKLEELTPGTPFDPHRFRPNIVVETDEDGFLETAWQGRKLAIGDVVLDISFTVPRCVMTTLEQGEHPADKTVLKAISEHNSIDVFGTGVAYPCLGAYAEVAQEGLLEVGQPVVLLP